MKNCYIRLRVINKSFEIATNFSQSFVHFCVILPSPLTDASRWKVGSFLGGSRTGIEFDALKKFNCCIKQCYPLQVL